VKVVIMLQLPIN